MSDALPDILLSVSSVETGYGQVKVLKGVSLNVNEGEIVTVLGANGAGKTTLLMAISGIQPVWTGSISFKGEELSKYQAHERVGLGLAHVPEGRHIFPRQTVQENLELGAFLRSDTAGIRADMERAFSLFPVLKDRRRQQGGTLSGGEQQMLAIGRALMSKPRMLLLDEPSMGIAPLVVEKIFQTIAELRAAGMTILLIEQNAHLALKVADRGYVMEIGQVAFHAKASELLTDPRVREAYLGE